MPPPPPPHPPYPLSPCPPPITKLKSFTRLDTEQKVSHGRNEREGREGSGQKLIRPFLILKHAGSSPNGLGFIEKVT